jgi:hypothetical protein
MQRVFWIGFVCKCEEKIVMVNKIIGFGDLEKWKIKNCEWTNNWTFNKVLLSLCEN